MVNSLGLDVDGSSETQPHDQTSDNVPYSSPRNHQEDTELSWGIQLNTKEDVELSWGTLLQSSATEGAEDSWGEVEVPKDTQSTVTENGWGPMGEVQKVDGSMDPEESWGKVEGNDDGSRGDESKGLEDNWGTQEKTATTHKDDKPKKDKGMPYVPATPPARAKMSPDELAQRMEKIRLQNEKIKERREYVKADEEAFNTSVAVDRARQAANRKIQAQVNQSREQNAKRKLEKMGNREWDLGKHGGEWKQSNRGRGGGNSISTSRDKGRQPTSANLRNHLGGSLPATNEVVTPSSKDPSHNTPPMAADLSSSQPETQGVEKQD